MLPRALFLILLLAAVPATAAAKWTEVRTKNFLLVGDASPNQIREVGEGLELFRWGFLQFFKIPQSPSPVATTVVVFKDDNAFKPHKPLYKGKPANIAGYFQPGPDLNFIALTGDEETPRVIYHELVHRMMDDNFGNLPVWFQEGFAEAFGSLEVEGNGRKIRSALVISDHIALLNQRQFMPLDRLFAVVHGSVEYNEEEKQGLLYAQSWALVHYLMLGDGGKHRPQFMQFIAGFRQSPERPQADLFSEVFKTSLPDFQRLFEAYILERLAWPAIQIDSPAGFERNIEMTTREMSEAEGEFYLGDLHLHTNNMALAEKHLQKSIQLNANHAGAQAAMGRIRMAQSNDAQATEHFQRAIALDDKNHLIHYYYALLLRKQEATEREIMRGSLKKAVALAPQFREGMEMLAWTNINANVEIPETIAMLDAAAQSTPGNESLLTLLVLALSRSANREQARPLARHILSSPAATPEMKQNVQSVIDFLDRVAAAEKAAAARGVPRVNAAVPNRAQPELQPPADESRPELTRTAPPELEPETTEATVIAPERPRPDGSTVIRGVLTLLDCTNGLTVSLTVEGKTVRLHTAQPTRIVFTSYSPDVIGSIGCGPVPNRPVRVTYFPRTSPESIGEPVTIDFVEP